MRPHAVPCCVGYRRSSATPWYLSESYNLFNPCTSGWNGPLHGFRDLWRFDMFPCLLRQYSVLPNAYASENLWPPEMINRFGSSTDVVCVSPARFHIDPLPVREIMTRSMPASPLMFPSPFLTGAPTMHTLMILLSTFYTSYTTIHLRYKTNKKEILPPPVLTRYTKMHTHSKKHSCYTNNTKNRQRGKVSFKGS